MRVATAAGIVVAIVVAKAGFTWVALKVWGSLPERPAFAQQWHIELGNLANWVGALLTLAAVITALIIAGKDRRVRRAELLAQDAAQARLVLMQGGVGADGQVIAYVTNHGDRPILDFTVDSAELTEVSKKSVVSTNWRLVLGDRIPPVRPILLPDPKEQGMLLVQFLDDEGRPFFKRTKKSGSSLQDFVDRGMRVPDPRGFQATVWIRFMDASGHWWRRSSEGELEHTTKPPAPPAAIAIGEADE
ncbi:MAG TPA: hypothetical protein VMU34_06400 [Mycobacterium sp.]|nr:hypothetical protein [Mycobacterium sp.]